MRGRKRCACQPPPTSIRFNCSTRTSGRQTLGGTAVDEESGRMRPFNPGQSTR